MTLEMSDSLKATVIVRACVLTISTKPLEDPELLDDEPELEPEPPRLPAVVEPDPPAALPEPEPLDALEDPEPDEDPPPEMASPGESAATDTTVPVAGA